MWFEGGVALESDYARRVGSYAFKARLLLLTTLKSPTVPLISSVQNMRTHLDLWWMREVCETVFICIGHFPKYEYVIEFSFLDDQLWVFVHNIYTTFI